MVELWVRIGRSNLAFIHEFHRNLNTFIMQQCSDIGQTALLPFRGSYADDFARKFQQLIPGLDPPTSVPESSIPTTRTPKPLAADNYLIITQSQSVYKIDHISKFHLYIYVFLDYNMLCLIKIHIYYFSLLQPATFLLLYSSHRYLYFNSTALYTLCDP
jgi:hypothetical protein